MANLNHVSITGNLTRDPELRELPSGTPKCRLRIASTTRQRSGDEWVDRPNYFDVIVWGALGSTCAKHLTTGRKIGVSGRLEWSEWDEQVDGQPTGRKRSHVQIVAEQVEFLDAPKRAESDDTPAAAEPAESASAPNEPDASSHKPEDDIPF